jgi:hypothetical protein
VVVDQQAPTLQAPPLQIPAIIQRVKSPTLSAQSFNVGSAAPPSGVGEIQVEWENGASATTKQVVPKGAEIHFELKDGAPTYRCDPCNVSCINLENFTEHLNGKKHSWKNCLSSKKNMAVVAPTVAVPAVAKNPNLVPQSFNVCYAAQSGVGERRFEWKDGAPTATELAAPKDKETSFGLEDGAFTHRCGLCNVTCIKQGDFMEHLKGINHKRHEMAVTAPAMAVHPGTKMTLVIQTRQSIIPFHRPSGDCEVAQRS